MPIDRSVMRAVLLSQYFPPETVEYADDLARHLAGEGHQVTVITGYPNWPSGEFADGYDPSGISTESIDGFEVVRVPIRAGELHRTTGRIRNYLSFAASSLRARRHIREADVVYVYATPLTASTAALFGRLLDRVPFVLHVQDVWPESVTESRFLSDGPTRRIAHRLLDWYARWNYALAAQVVVIAPSMNRLLQSRGARPDQLTTLFNWADEATVPRSAPDPNGPRTFLYAGNLGAFQDLDTLIGAFNDLADAPDHQLLIAGSGTEEQRLRELAAGNPRIHFLGRLSQADLAAYYERAHFHLVTLKNLEIFTGTIPSKFQSAMCAGAPVITTVPGDLTEIVETNRVGLTAAAEDRTSLAQTFRRAIQMPASEVAELARNARTFYEESMSRAQGVNTIEDLLQAAATTRPAATRTTSTPRTSTAPAPAA